jgi:ankyrin repeat protein
VEIVKLLIEKNAKVNVEEEGQRALIIAAHGGHSEIVTILLNANACRTGLAVPR